jgi:hypothetical protein
MVHGIKIINLSKNNCKDENKMMKNGFGYNGIPNYNYLLNYLIYFK